MNYYSFHIGDYRGATAHLSNDEDLCYRRMLDLYYDKEGILPPIEIISRRARFPESLVQSILREFFIQTESGWLHDRAQKEIESYQLQSKGGKKGAEARWGKNGVPIAPPCKPHMGLDTPPIAPLIATNNQEPITKNHTPPTPKGNEQEEKALSRAKALFRMRDTTPLDKAQSTAWKSARTLVMETPEQDWQALEAVFSSTDPDTVKYRKQNLSTLLNQWNDCVIRAKSTRKTDSTPRKPDGSIDYYADAVSVFGEESVVRVAAR